MTTTSTKMSRHSIAFSFVIILSVMVTLSSCKKNGDYHHNKTSTYSAEVLDKWMTMQIRLMKNATGIQNQAFSRHFVYAGIAAVEAMAPDMPAQARWSGSWNGLSGLPSRHPSDEYYYPANVNADERSDGKIRYHLLGFFIKRGEPAVSCCHRHKENQSAEA